MEMNNQSGCIAVMAASFNPPVNDDLRLMLAALDGLGAGKGVFVPAGEDSVKAEMRKEAEDAVLLPGELRMDMLRAMCEDDPRLAADDVEYIQPETSGRPYEMMQALQQKHPHMALYYVTDAEKLASVARWRAFPQFIEEFRLVVFTHAEEETEKLIAKTKRLREHRSAITLLPMPEAMERSDAGALRDAVAKGEIPAGMLHSQAAALLDGYLHAPPPAKITSFRGKYAFLSNLTRADVCWQGLVFQNSEAAFQAAKCLTVEERLPFTTMQPVVAKRQGKRVRLRGDWEEVKDGVMEGIVRAKFRQNPDLAQKLLATGDAEIAEGNTWGDTYWGVDVRTGRGKNQLGRTLMKIRAELRADAETP